MIVLLFIFIIVIFIQYIRREPFVDQWKSACDETEGCNAAINKSNWTKVTGMNYGGNDITSVDNSTAEQCQSLCTSTTECVGALLGNETYGNKCWLKNDLTPAPNADANLILYIPKSQDSNWTKITEMNYGGNDITSIENSTPEQCQSLCRATSGCVGALVGNETYGNKCWLKNEITSSPNADANLTFYTLK
jgi:hypothetical protein